MRCSIWVILSHCASMATMAPSLICTCSVFLHLSHSDCHYTIPGLWLPSTILRGCLLQTCVSFGTWKLPEQTTLSDCPLTCWDPTGNLARPRGCARSPSPSTTNLCHMQSISLRGSVQHWTRDLWFAKPVLYHWAIAFLHCSVCLNSPSLKWLVEHFWDTLHKSLILSSASSKQSSPIDGKFYIRSCLSLSLPW